MQLTNEIKTYLKREYSLYSGAVSFYKKAVKEFEKNITSRHRPFLKSLRPDKWAMKQTTSTGMHIPSSLQNGRNLNLLYVRLSGDRKIH